MKLIRLIACIPFLLVAWITHIVAEAFVDTARLICGHDEWVGILSRVKGGTE